MVAEMMFVGGAMTGRVAHTAQIRDVQIQGCQTSKVNRNRPTYEHEQPAQSPADAAKPWDLTHKDVEIIAEINNPNSNFGKYKRQPHDLKEGDASLILG